MEDNRQRTNRTTIGKNPFDTVIPMPENDGDGNVAKDVQHVRREPPPTLRQPIQSSPAPGQQVIKRKQKLTIHLDEDLANRVKNAAYWNPRLSIARIAERGIRKAIEEVERENKGRYPQREAELVGGRPMK